MLKAQEHRLLTGPCQPDGLLVTLKPFQVFLFALGCTPTSDYNCIAAVVFLAGMAIAHDAPSLHLPPSRNKQSCG